MGFGWGIKKLDIQGCIVLGAEKGLAVCIGIEGGEGGWDGATHAQVLPGRPSPAMMRSGWAIMA